MVTKDNVGISQTHFVDFVSEYYVVYFSDTFESNIFEITKTFFFHDLI